MPSVGVFLAAFLSKRGLDEHGEDFAVWADGQAFEALVIVASGLGVFRCDLAVRIVAWLGGGGEAARWWSVWLKEKH